MFSTLKLFLYFCFVGLSYARSEAEIKNYFLGLGIECNNEVPITTSEMQLLHEHKVPDSENAKCLLYCVYKKATWMNDKGELDLAAVNAMMDKEHVDDPEKREKSNKLFEECKKVNDIADEKGCERAGELTKCLVGNAPKLGLAVVI